MGNVVYNSHRILIYPVQSHIPGIFSYAVWFQILCALKIAVQILPKSLFNWNLARERFKLVYCTLLFSSIQPLFLNYLVRAFPNIWVLSVTGKDRLYNSMATEM